MVNPNRKQPYPPTAAMADNMADRLRNGGNR